MAVSFRRGEDPSAAMAELKKENLALQQERDWILESNDIDPDDLAETPLCPHCGGSGYVGAVMCDCLRELCRQEQKKELSQLIGSGRESFDRFRLDVYSSEFDPKLGASPRTLMQYIYNNALHYARTFTPESGSILMIGATGLGKTFLSACIARIPSSTTPPSISFLTLKPQNLPAAPKAPMPRASILPATFSSSTTSAPK